MTHQPTAAADQAQAANAEAASMVAGLIGPLNARRVHIPTPPPWLADLVGEINRLTTTGQALQCEHLRNVPVQVTHIGAWAPEIHLCSDCVAAGGWTAILNAGEESSTCDLCRTTTRPIHGTVVQAGRHVISVGLCTACRDSAYPDDTPGVPAGPQAGAE